MKKLKERYYRTSINLKDEEVWHKFKAVCYLKSKTVSEQIEELLKEFISKNLERSSNHE